MEDLYNRLLEWRYVTGEQEYEKYFRYACFKIKWLKITKQREIAVYHLNSFIEAAYRGQDVAVSLTNLLQIADSDLQAELIEAIKPISDRSLKGLTTKEIKSAKDIATQLWQQSVLEEGVIAQTEELFSE